MSADWWDMDACLAEAAEAKGEPYIPPDLVDEYRKRRREEGPCDCSECQGGTDEG